MYRSLLVVDIFSILVHESASRTFPCVPINRSLPRNRFLCSLKVYKFGLCSNLIILDHRNQQESCTHLVVSFNRISQLYIHLCLKNLLSVQTSHSFQQEISCTQLVIDIKKLYRCAYRSQPAMSSLLHQAVHKSSFLIAEGQLYILIIPANIQYTSKS